jgi:hypothetical protein
MSVTWCAVSFWTEKLIKVLIRSFSKTEVSSVMQIETQKLKNKVFKTQGPKRCLTLIFNQLILRALHYGFDVEAARFVHQRDSQTTWDTSCYSLTSRS